MTITNQNAAGSPETTVTSQLSSHSNTWSSGGESYLLDEDGKLPAYVDLELVNSALETHQDNLKAMQDILDT